MSFSDIFHILAGYGDYFKSYIPSWIITIAIFMTSFLMEKGSQPFKRHFLLNDPSISYPFSQHERFNDTKLWLFAGILPYTAIVALTLFKYMTDGHDRRAKYIHLLHVTSLSFMLAMAVNGFVTEFLKLRIGKMRPDFLERCGPLVEPGIDTIAKVYNETICQKPLGEYLFKDGFKSCPSGHSSISWCGFNFLNLWLSGQFSLHAPTVKNEDKTGTFHRFHLAQLVNLIPLGCALQISLSRSQDYRHDFIDISLGSFIGFVTSTFIYGQFFRSIFGYHSQETKFDDYKELEEYEEIPI